MKEIIIKESQWGRGTGKGMLLNPLTKKKCCLGFVCSQLGFEEIAEMGMPGDLGELIPGLTYGCGGEWYNDTDFSRQAAEFNDSNEITDDERKLWLKILAKDAGYKFTFVP